MKWLLQNARQRLRFAVKNPRYAAAAIFHELTLADERFLAHITNSSVTQIRAHLNEPIATPLFADLLRTAQQEFGALASAGADLYAKKILYQYVVARALKPNCIVETGIANGVSSAYLLLAIEKNGYGHLHSVGLDDPAFVPTGREVGWLVPPWLRKPWKVHWGNTREILPHLLAELKQIDIFIHDSLHTYDHMLWEFKTAYPYLRPGGVLLSDDALWNTSFSEFAGKSGESDYRILRGIGCLKKNRPDGTNTPELRSRSPQA